MPQAANPNAEMPFLQHLAELRTRVGRALLAVLVATLLCFYRAEYIFAFLTGPVRAAFSELQLIGIDPMEAFLCKLKASIAAGVILSSPFSFYQVWLFIAPGLHENERKFAIPFIVITTACFISGAAFCFYAVLPFALSFFASEYLSIGLAQHIQIGKYLAFVVWLSMVFGAVFELPVLFYFLARLKLVTHTWMKKKFRYAVVVIFIAAGVLTPSPDITTQCLLAGPLLLIYTLCIFIVAKVNPQAIDKPSNSA